MKPLKMLAALVLLLVFTIPSTFALWQYANTPPTPGSMEIITSLGEFKESKGVIIKSVEEFSKSGIKVINSGYSLKAIHNSTVDPTQNGGSIT